MLRENHSLGRSDAGINALSAILQRLQRVEKYCTAVPSLSLDPSPQSDSTEPTSIQNVLSTDRETNVATMLREAVSQVQKLRLQTFSKSVITQHVHIPPKLAKTWIKGTSSDHTLNRQPCTVELRIVANICSSLLLAYAYGHVHHFSQRETY